MPRGEIISHKGNRIVHIDLSNGSIRDVEEAIALAQPLIRSQNHKSVLCWVNTEGTKMSVEISEALKAFTLGNKPYIKMTAITGISGVQKVVLSAVIMFTKRDNLVVKDSREQALDFLAEVGSRPAEAEKTAAVARTPDRGDKNDSAKL